MKNREEQELGFKVPKNYFEKLEDILQDKIPNQDAKIIPFYSQKWFYAVSSIAAITIIVIALFVNTKSNLIDDNTIVDIDYMLEESVADTEDLSLLDYYISDINQSDLAEIYILENVVPEGIQKIE